MKKGDKVRLKEKDKCKALYSEQYYGKELEITMCSDEISQLNGHLYVWNCDIEHSTNLHRLREDRAIVSSMLQRYTGDTKAAADNLLEHIENEIKRLEA